MEETSNLRRYVRNKKIFIPAFIGMIVLFFALIGITGDRLFALAINEMAGYLVDNDSFGETELTIENGDWGGEGTAEAAVSPGVFDEKGVESAEHPVKIALAGPEGEAPRGGHMLEEAARVAQADEGAETEAAAVTEAEPESEPEPGAEPEEKQEIVRQHVRAYSASYLRDPFYSLIAADKDMPNKLLDVSRAKMVGSVWGESSIIGLLEDDAGRSYALKAGDKVVNGKVVSVSPASVTFSVTVFGLTRNVTLELSDEGEW